MTKSSLKGCFFDIMDNIKHRERFMKKEALYVMEQLNKHGYSAYMVGGCVRDMIMDNIPHDIDIATAALPPDVKAIFGEKYTYETGIKHGTVTVTVNKIPIEITTYRRESDYTDGRHPDFVNFVSDITEDLARRDFTINAIAMDKEGNIIDCFGGTEDIKDSIIRCVGDADKRLEEDALRILRGLRFGAVLGFEIESDTEKAMRKNKKLLDGISAERKATELVKLINGKYAGRIIYEYSDILDEIIPGIHKLKGFEQYNPYHVHDILKHTCTVIDNVKSNTDIRIAALLHDIGKPYCHTRDDRGIDHFRGHCGKSKEIAENILSRLKFDKKTKETVLTLIKYHDCYVESDIKIIKRMLGKMGNDIFKLLELRKGDMYGQNPHFLYRLNDVENAIKSAQEIIDQGECFSVKDLDIKGNDIAAIGLKGAEIGRMLDILVENVIEEKVENKKQSLIRFAKEVIKNEYR